MDFCQTWCACLDLLVEEAVNVHTVTDRDEVNPQDGFSCRVLAGTRPELGYG